MKIELLGDHCRICQRLRGNIERTLQGCSDQIELQNICEPQRFAEYGFFPFPLLPSTAN